jgi:SAM-dependent methyltransferase
MFNVLAYSDNPGGALEHAIRALRPGGRLFVKDTDLQSDFFHPVPLDLYHCVVKAAIESSERPRVGNYDPFFARRIPSLLRSLSHCRVIPRSYSFSVFFPVTPEERFFITANAEMLSTLAQLGGNTDLADAWMMLFKDTSKSNVFSSPEFIYSMNEYLFEVTAL